MPSHNDLPGDIKRKKFTKALHRLGFIINRSGGNGSHIKIVWLNQKSITIPEKLPKQTLKYVLDEIEKVTGVSWEDIKREL